jgi:hypothetical protein
LCACDTTGQLPMALSFLHLLSLIFPFTISLVAVSEPGFPLLFPASSSIAQIALKATETSETLFRDAFLSTPNPFLPCLSTGTKLSLLCPFCFF